MPVDAQTGASATDGEATGKAQGGAGTVTVSVEGKGGAGGGGGGKTASEAGGGAAATVTATEAGKATEQVESTWRDDWRDAIIAKLPAEEREKETKRLARFQSPENVYRSFRDIERRVSSGMLKPSLAEGANEAEVAEYRKANGIPEKADVAAYGLTFPQGYEASDADKADVSEFVASMHKDHVPPGVVQKVWAKYLDVKGKAEQQLYEAAQQQTINQKAELKAEFGRDFDRNTRLGNSHLIQTVGEDQAKGFMALTLADGTKLGDHPAFVRYIVAQALAAADDTTLVTNEFGDNGQSVADQYKAALDLKFTDPKKYATAEHQSKLRRLASAKVAKEGKRAA